jgi:mRNA-degrading endonuclease RelE of RelBE toxin-antitoxin system
MILRGAPFSFRYDRAAEKDLNQLSSVDQLRFVEALEALAQTGYGDLKPLQAVPGVYRLRVGNLRGEMFVFWNAKELVVLRVFHRQAGYGKRARQRR